MRQLEIEVNTRGRGCYDLSEKVASAVHQSDIDTGLCHIFLRHTSASLMLCESADPVVLRDIEAFMSRLVPDGDALFEHTAEGPDDMPAHVRSVLTHNDLTVPIRGGRLDLGTWQGIYLWEHRQAAHRRCITLTLSGE